MTATIEKLIAEQPHFHAWPDGRPANWSVAPDVLRFIADRVRPGMRTLETGAGHTTVAFCAAGARHVAITPDREQAERIRAWLEGAGATAPTFVHESSDTALPTMADDPEPLDFVFVDGAHRFPFAMIDWHYTERRVPVGGIVGVDDIRMPSVKILYDFLAGEEDWRLVEAFEVTAFFERVRKTENKWDWADQTMNHAFWKMVTAGVGENAEAVTDDEAETDDAVTNAPGEGERASVDLRGAKLQIKDMTRRMRTMERDLTASQNTLRQVRHELWLIKGSRTWRLIDTTRRMTVDPVRRVLRKLRGR